MIDISLLGTGGMMPLPYRWLTSLLVRVNGKCILTDCGEGTQIALKKAGWSPNPIDIILITHFHADHISGLPGLLLSIGNAERTQPLLIIGPKGLSKVVASLRIIAPELPFVVECLELTDKEQIIEFDEFRIEAFRVNHNVTCYGYSFVMDRAGKFDVEKAQALELDVKYWNCLQKGEIIKLDGKTYTPDMVMGPQRKGLRVTYCTDTRPTQAIIDHCKDADLCILEGMYGEPSELSKAKDKKHMTFFEAASIAREAQAKRLWLTHYSPSLNRPKDYIDATRKIFPNAVAAKDGQFLELTFEGENTEGEEES